MFHSNSENADPIGFSEEKDKKVSPSPENARSSDSSEYEQDHIERASTIDLENEAQEDEKTSVKKSGELTRTTSNALSRVASRMTSHSIRDPGPPPDGGLVAWTQVVLGWLAIFTTWGWINCFGVFQTYYTLHLDVSPSTISWIGTIQNFLSFFIGAFSGRLLDAGYFLPTIIVGVTLQQLGIFMMSISTKYWQLLLTQGIVNGIGSGIFFTPCLSLLATYFDKRRATAMGIASTGNATGGMIYPLIVRQLLPQIGFGWTVRVLGFLNLALLALVIAFMKPRLPPRKSGPVVEWSAFKEKPYALYTLGLFFQIWCLYFTLYYVASFGVQQIGLPFSDSTNLLIIVNGIGVPGRLVPAYIADKIGNMNTIVPVGAAVTVVAYCWAGVSSVTGIYVWVCFFGVLIAAFQCLLPPVVASLTDDMTKIGTRIGMVFSCMGFAALTGPPIGGAIVDSQGNYLGAQMWAATASLLCISLTITARMAKAKWKIKVKV